MRFKLALITSAFSILSPIFAIVIMCSVEQELIEAVLSGLLIGCFVGTIFGIISLILNKGKSRAVKIVSIIPMCPLAIYILLLLPRLFYK